MWSVVWDGMRPDFVSAQYTPQLYDLAQRGTFFKNHHSIYITSTEVKMHRTRDGCISVLAVALWPTA